MKNRFLWQLLAAFVLAIIVGLLLGDKATYVQPLGDLFLRLIRFIIVPLILATIIVGVTSAGSMKKLGRLGGKTIAFYLTTSFFAITIGLLVALLLSPGTGVNVSLNEENIPAGETQSVIDTLLNIIPTNPIESLATANILQIIFFAIFLGLGITLAGDKAAPVQRFFDGLAEVMYKVTAVVMKLVPLGIFGLLAPIVGQYGLDVLMPLMKLIIAILIASVLHIVVIYSIALKTLGKMSPLQFLKGILPAVTVAFTTCSSAGTLPVTMKNTQENLGVSKETSSFVLPLGATINMDGTAIYQGIAVMFTAQYFVQSLSIGQLLIVALVATLASIGTAGVPGAGMVMLAMTLAAVNLPLEAIALIAGIDRILDMVRTSVNVMGDATASVVVDQSENKHKAVVA